MRNKFEKHLGWVILICIILSTSVTSAFAGSEKGKSPDGGPGDTIGGGQPSCRC